MVDGGQKLSEIFQQYDPLLRFRTKKRENIILKEYVDRIQFTFEPTLSNKNIEFFNKVPEKINIRINPTDNERFQS